MQVLATSSSLTTTSPSLSPAAYAAGGQTDAHGAPHKRPRLNFTLKQRQQIWLYSQANPKMKQQELARWAKEAFAMDVEPSQSAISYAIRRHKLYEQLGEAEGRMKRPRNVKHPALDSALAKWVTDCCDSGTRISSLMVKQKASVLCDRLSIPKSARPTFSNGWLHAFNKRYGFRNYARHREVAADNQSLLAASSPTIPRKPRGPYSTAFKRSVVRFYKHSNGDMHATIREFFNTENVAAVFEKKSKFILAWVREDERIEALMAHDNVRELDAAAAIAVGAGSSARLSQTTPPTSLQRLPPEQSTLLPEPQQQEIPPAASPAQPQQSDHHHNHHHHHHHHHHSLAYQQPQRAPLVPSHVLSPAVEQVVVSWVLELRDASVPVSSTMLEQKAREVAADFGIQFTPSWTWRQEFLKRYMYPLSGLLSQPTAASSTTSSTVFDSHRMQQVTSGAMSDGQPQHYPHQPDHSSYSAAGILHSGTGASWRSALDSSVSGAYHTPLGSHQALLLNMRAPSVPSRFSIYQEQHQQRSGNGSASSSEADRPVLESPYFVAQAPPQFQPQPFPHQPALFGAQLSHQQQHQAYHHEAFHQHMLRQQHQQHQQQTAPAHIASAPSAHMHVPSAAVTLALAAPVDAAPRSVTPSTVTLDGTASTDSSRAHAPASARSGAPDDQVTSIRDLGDKVVEARNVERKLRVEGLEYDNELKRMRILEENILARKRLKDAGIAQDEIDKLLPLVALGKPPQDQ